MERYIISECQQELLKVGAPIEVVTDHGAIELTPEMSQAYWCQFIQNNYKQMCEDLGQVLVHRHMATEDEAKLLYISWLGILSKRKEAYRGTKVQPQMQRSLT